MTETVSITKANALTAIKAAKNGSDVNNVVAALFPTLYNPKNILERVTNIQEACIELGKDYATLYGSETDPYKKAQTEIETFAEALREGKPATECFYYPWFERSSAGGFSSHHFVCGHVYSLVGARLRVDRSDKAIHLGKCMIDQYNIMLKG